MRYSIYPKHPFKLPKEENRLVGRSACLCCALGLKLGKERGDCALQRVKGRAAGLQAGDSEDWGICERF